MEKSAYSRSCPSHASTGAGPSTPGIGSSLSADGIPEITAGASSFTTKKVSLCATRYTPPGISCNVAERKGPPAPGTVAIAIAAASRPRYAPGTAAGSAGSGAGTTGTTTASAKISCSQCAPA